MFFFIERLFSLCINHRSGFIGKELVAKGGETLIFVKGSMTKYKAISREIEYVAF